MCVEGLAEGQQPLLKVQRPFSIISWWWVVRFSLIRVVGGWSGRANQVEPRGHRVNASSVPGLELKRGRWWSPRDNAELGAWFLSSAFRDRNWWLGLVQWRELGRARTVLLRGCYMSAFVKYQSTHMFDVCRIKGEGATRATISLPVSLDAPLKRTLHLQICSWKSSLCLSSGEMQRY